jgi:GNAT superfamily N-acetyltransferase
VPHDIRFRAVRADEPPARELVAAMVEEVSRLYGDITLPGAPTATPAEMWAPHGTFLVGFDGASPVCAGGIKRLADDIAEIKRMYVEPGARGEGVGRVLLNALEEAARRLGYCRLRLDTGDSQPHAEALYRSAGYAEIPDYNGNFAASFWGEKAL